MQRRHFMQAGAALAAGLATGATWAQTYPERPIKIYQGFAPGGNADAIARAVSAEMTKTIGQPFEIGRAHV
jgi:tripartite-type tricarboxylate transporter receptor subunit TctC